MSSQRTVLLTLAAIALGSGACSDPASQTPNPPVDEPVEDPVEEPPDDPLLPPPQDNLVLWLDGDDPYGDGSELSGPLDVWVDKSPEGADFYYLPPAQDTRPEVVAVADGRTVVSFDGIDDALYSEGYGGLGWYDYTVIIIGHGKDDENVFLAGAGSETDGYGFLLETSQDRNLRALHRMPLGNVGGDNTVTTSGAMQQDAMNSIWLSRDFNLVNESPQSLFVNATVETVEAESTWFREDLDMSMGRVFEDDDRRALDGEIAEVLIYDRALTPESSPELVDYLYAKWGVTL